MDQLLRSDIIKSVVSNDEILRQLLALEARIVAQPSVSNSLKEWLHWIVIGVFILQFLLALYFSRKSPGGLPNERGVLNGEELCRRLDTLLRSSPLSNSSDNSRVSPPPSPEQSPSAVPSKVLTRSSTSVLANPAAGVMSPRAGL